jgi:hypothetical protein
MGLCRKHEVCLLESGEDGIWTSPRDIQASPRLSRRLSKLLSQVLSDEGHLQIGYEGHQLTHVSVRQVHSPDRSRSLAKHRNAFNQLLVAKRVQIQHFLLFGLYVAAAANCCFNASRFWSAASSSTGFSCSSSCPCSVGCVVCLFCADTA